MPVIDDELRPLVELAGELIEAGLADPMKPPDYRDSYTAAASARIPAVRIRGRWYVRTGDYPAIAAILCPPAQVLPPPRHDVLAPSERVAAGHLKQRNPVNNRHEKQRR